MKLTWLSRCLVAGLVTCALVSTAHAQAPGGTQGGRGRGGPGGGGFGGRGSSTSLISLAANEAVQKELALSDVIKDAIKEIDSSYRDAIQKAPLSGWIASSATGIDVMFLDRWVIPPIAPISEAWETAGFAVHRVLTKALMALVVLHIAGALNRAWLGDGTLRRMITGRSA